MPVKLIFACDLISVRLVNLMKIKRMLMGIPLIRLVSALVLQEGLANLAMRIEMLQTMLVNVVLIMHSEDSSLMTLL